MRKHLVSVKARTLALFVAFFLIFIFKSSAQTWKEEAWERINTHRKNDLTITIRSKSGEPLRGATVKVKLKRHAFNFGAVMKSSLFNSSPHSDVYKDLYLTYFNGGGFEVGMKPKHRGRFWEEQVELAMPWFNENNIIMRGHALVWEGYNFLPADAVTVYDNLVLTDEEKGDSLIQVLDDHIYHAIPKWDVAWWDVVNEPVVNNIVNNLLPDYNTFTHWFKLADSVRNLYNKQHIPLVLNENQIISGNAPWVEGKIDEFQTIVDQMLTEGAPLEMLGFQSRNKFGMLPPETQYARLLSFDQYDIPYQATEFEIRDSPNYTYTDAEVKQLTEETMIIYFSHPKVKGFWHWTFADDEEGNAPWALFNYDGTPKPTGEKWIELMEGDFDTDTTLITNNVGQCVIRGFKGDYEINISNGDSTITKSFLLDQDAEMFVNTPFDDVLTSIENVSKDDDFRILVSPIQRRFSVLEGANIRKISLLNLHGSLVREYNVDYSYSLEGMPSGFYLVLIETNNNAIVRKLLLR